VEVAPQVRGRAVWLVLVTLPGVVVSEARRVREARRAQVVSPAPRQLAVQELVVQELVVQELVVQELVVQELVVLQGAGLLMPACLPMTPV
jgi:hypothetical protein